MQYIFRELLNKISYTKKSDDNDFIKCLRQEAAKWACILGISECKNSATSKLLWHLEDPKKHE